MRAGFFNFVGFGLFGLAGIALAQQAATTKPGSIEGRVMDAATGAPLRKTTLTLRPDT